MTNAEISAALAGCGYRTAEIWGTDGGSLLVTNAGMRVLRLTSRSGNDFFWLHGALVDGDPQRFLTSPGWVNFGGDRTWLAPESDLFMGDIEDPVGTYFVPEAFDPGWFELEASGVSVRLWGQFELANLRLGHSAKLRLEKTIVPAANPFKDMPDVRSLRAAEYIGYEQETTLTLLSTPSPGLRFGLWHLVQVRAPGNIIIPVADRTGPRTIMGRPTSQGLKLEPGLVRFRVGAPEQSKISLKAASLIGRAGFLQDRGADAWTLVVRNFQINPSAHYVDTPWDDLQDTGYAIQCYNDDGDLGDFGELEYHAPAIGDGTGASECTDRSQLWAFRAEPAIIDEIARRLLHLGG